MKGRVKIWALTVWVRFLQALLVLCLVLMGVSIMCLVGALVGALVAFVRMGWK